MVKYMDYMISKSPIRVFAPAVDSARRRIRSLSIVNAGHLPGRTLLREKAVFSYWAVVIITGGQGHYQVDGGEVQSVRAGSWFCLYPGSEFNYGPDEGGHWDEYYFTVEGSRVKEWLSDWLFPDGKVRPVLVDEILIQRMESLFRLIDSGVPDNLDRAVLQLEMFLYELVSLKEGPTAGNREQFAQRIIEDLGHSLHAPVTAAAFAARHHISVSTLRRIIHEYTGYPFNEFLHRLKVAEARNILLNTELSVKEIAEHLGYHDMFYFSRVFKRITGAAPREYRNRVGP